MREGRMGEGKKERKVVRKRNDSAEIKPKKRQGGDAQR